ncbi:MAG: ComEC/Rec2 family competence protein, partial [Candidatus Zambryskibacteria bacterium]|nr:ComEC/Rec2 family competence protein [Candidatus Zambryskibacteria bacterium]
YRYFIEGKERLTLTFIVLVMFGVLCGIGRMYVSNLYTHSQLDRFAQQKISVEGIIVDEPDVRENNTKLTVGLRNIFIGTTTVAVNEKILVSVPIYPEFKYGDKVKMTVTLNEPTEIETEGRIFDYKGYLRVRGIWYTSRYTTITLESGGHGSVIKNLLFKIKNIFTDSLNNVLPQPESSLMAGLLLGTKQSLGKDLLTEFQRTGVSHIVVLSGYNIAVVASSIMTLFKFLPKNLSFGFGALSIVLFTILSGGGASAWRAAIMVLVALFAKKMNRDYKVSRVFGFTIVLMLAPNPLLLAFDPSFQLSVLATIGLIFVSPYITPYLLWVTEKFGLREIVSSTIATQITVLPYLIYNMGIFSLVSLPVNILILGTIPLTMLLGFITGIVGLISLYLSFIPAFFSYILLWYQLTVVHIGASIPFGAITLPAFSPIILVFIYLIIFTGLYFIKKKNQF